VNARTHLHHGKFHVKANIHFTLRLFAHLTLGAHLGCHLDFHFTPDFKSSVNAAFSVCNMDVFSFVFAYLAWNKSFDFPAQKRISSSWLEWSLSTHKHTSTHKNTYRLSFVILLGTNIVFEDSTLIYIYIIFIFIFNFLNSPKYSLCSFTKKFNEKIKNFTN